jgi:hypothetical protein
MTFAWVSMAVLFMAVAVYSYFWPHDSAQASLYIIAALVCVVAARMEELLKPFQVEEVEEVEEDAEADQARGEDL